MLLEVSEAAQEPPLNWGLRATMLYHSYTHSKTHAGKGGDSSHISVWAPCHYWRLQADYCPDSQCSSVSVLSGTCIYIFSWITVTGHIEVVVPHHYLLPSKYLLWGCFLGFQGTFSLTFLSSPSLYTFMAIKPEPLCTCLQNQDILFLLALTVHLRPIAYLFIAGAS